MRRSKVDIIIDILNVVKKGADKTSIVYKTDLNFKLIDKYLDLLQKYGLIENRSDKYIATKKGNIFIERARQITLYLEGPGENFAGTSILSKTNITGI